MTPTRGTRSTVGGVSDSPTTDTASPTAAEPTGPAPAPVAKPRNPARVAIVLGLVVLALFCLIAVAATTKTDDVTGRVSGKAETASRPGLGPEAGSTRPLEVESVTPRPSDVVGPQPEIIADLAAGFTGELVIDGIDIPVDQTTRIPGLGTISFRPTKGKDVSRFDAGVHTVRVVYWPDASTRERDARTFDWSFRVAA